MSGSGSESAAITLSLPDDVQIADSLTVAGNLTVNGTLTSLDTTNLDIEDNLFQLNAGLTGSPVNDSGMLINRGTADNGIFMWDESVDKFTLGLTTADGTSTGNITLSSLGTLVANIEGDVTGAITGTVSSLSNHDTDSLSEGSSNLYYTDARVQAVSINNVVEDTTPQLGGNLDLNSSDITGTGDINITGTVNGLNLAAGSIATTTAQNFAINTPNSLRINIDSNDSNAGEIFAVGHNQTAVDGSNNVLFLIQAVNERAGFGTTSLNANLHVGSSNAVGDTTNPAFQIGGASTYRLGMYTSTEGAVIENKNGDDGIQFRVKTAGEAMRIDGGTGKVGIGTTSPSQKLDVQGTAMMERSRLSTNDGTTYWDLRRDSSTGHFVISDDGLGDVVTIKQDTGNVGIGASPSYPFHVTGSGDTVAAVTSGASSIAALNLGNSTDKADGGIRYDNSTNDLILRAGNATRFTLDPSGNIIQTGNTNSVLSFTIKTSATNDYNGVLKFNDNSGTRSSIMSDHYNNALIFKHNSDTERMRIDAAGNVGIGTSSPAKLGLTGSSVGKVLHLQGDDCQIRLTNSILHADNSGNTVFHIRNNYGATSALAQIRYESGYHSWYTGTSFDEKMRLQNNTLYVSTDIGAHSNVTSFAHSTYAHAAVFGANSTPDGTVVIEDYDVSSGIGNTVLKCYLRDQDPATLAVFVDFSDGGGRVGSITHNDDGGGVTYNTTSDYRLKENINYTWDALPLINQLKPAKFNFIGKTDKTRQGFLAHEVSDIVPGSVRGEKDHMMEIGNVLDHVGNVVHEGVYEHFAKADQGHTWEQTGTEPLYQELDYSRLVPLLTKAIQEQQTIIDNLKSRIETLEG